MEDEENIDWGVPNWRDDKEYEFARPDISNPLANDQLRWEFLRRDQNYRRDWQDLEKSRSFFRLIEPLDPKVSSKELGDRSILFIDSVLRGGILGETAPRNIAAKKFPQKYGEHVLGLENDGFVIVGFDPLHPTKPQIKRAEKILNHYRQKLEKEDPEEIIFRENTPHTPQQLLRVLDAHNEGVKLQEIGQVIYFLTGNDPDQTSHARSVAHTQLKAAKTYWQRISIPKK